MNLRKDHSHVILTVWCEILCETVRRWCFTILRAFSRVIGNLPFAFAKCICWLPSIFVKNPPCSMYEKAASVMDALVQTTMKGAVKCIRHCELQNSVNQWGIERILCFWDIPASMLESVPCLEYCSSASRCGVCVRQSAWSFDAFRASTFCSGKKVTLIFCSFGLLCKGCWFV